MQATRRAGLSPLESWIRSRFKKQELNDSMNQQRQLYFYSLCDAKTTFQTEYTVRFVAGISLFWLWVRITFFKSRIAFANAFRNAFANAFRNAFLELLRLSSLSQNHDYEYTVRPRKTDPWNKGMLWPSAGMAGVYDCSMTIMLSNDTLLKFLQSSIIEQLCFQNWMSKLICSTFKEGR